MRIPRRAFQVGSISAFSLVFACACAYDTSLREYLDAHFWLPFSKQGLNFEKKDVVRANAPFAGMGPAGGEKPLAKLRHGYQELATSNPGLSDQPMSSTDPARVTKALVSARADPSLTRREREEVTLVDAKIDMRLGELDTNSDELLKSSAKKIQAFLQVAETPEFRSEARGWLAHVYYLLGDQTAAGRIYLDELNRNGSNLSRETLLNSLRMNYGYDGGHDLVDHLSEYFDTPEHASFAIQMATNPHWDRRGERKDRAEDEPETYAQIKALLKKHATLLASENGNKVLALLEMRIAMRMGDPSGALEVASMVPGEATLRSEPDFLWMSAAAHFLSHDFAGAEEPLHKLFRSNRASENQKAAAAYGLCGVYFKTGNSVEQIHFALWLHRGLHDTHNFVSDKGNIADQSIYWAVSGWDLNMLLESESSDDALESFLSVYPDLPDVRLVRYALAVRMARENRYAEAAHIYESIQATWRVRRMQRLDELYRGANRTDLAAPQLNEARYRLADYISANSDRIYFNDQLWSGLQRYAFTASDDDRLTRHEREGLIAGERKLKDDQEERWRAYLILRGVVSDAGSTDVGRKSAQLAIRCLRGISDRFDRNDEIERAEVELSKWLRR